jgi:CheY-like chemotaxis protein
VTTAGSAAEALASIDRVVPDVLLSDIGMPHEDGYSLIRRLRARTSEKGGSIPAVALTAYASDGDRDAAMSAGFQAHISKPFDPRDVASVVARLGRDTPTRA